MSHTTSSFTSHGDSAVPHIRRRRHASHSAGPGPNWTRRAGVAGGVISTTLALGSMATPSSAESLTANEQTGSIPTLSTTESSTQAVQALDQSAVDLHLDAERERAAAAARKKAERTKAAEAARKAAAQTATTRAAGYGTVSRSAGRTTLSSASGGVESVLGFLKAQVGKPYVYGATGPSAYDCSGLTRAAFSTVGVDLPRTSQDQSTVGTPVSVSEVRPGDLLFWGGSGSAYHVAVYLGDDQYVDAANPSKGVVIQKMSYYMPTSAMRLG
jgi:peptidoglycan DL-endopeptidase CwlO